MTGYITRTMLPMIALLFLWTVPLLSAPPAVGPPVDVAPDVEGTRLQKWPCAAWCESAECWLVVWREGDIAEQRTDIRCARVSAEGKALDPAGIRITSAAGLKDHAAVASDGTGMHALSTSMSTKIPARPRSPTTFVANSTSGSVIDASTTNTAPEGSGRVRRYHLPDAPTDPPGGGSPPAPPLAPAARGRRGARDGDVRPAGGAAGRSRRGCRRARRPPSCARAR